MVVLIANIFLFPGSNSRKGLEPGATARHSYRLKPAMGKIVESRRRLQLKMILHFWIKLVTKKDSFAQQRQKGCRSSMKKTHP